MIPSGATAGRIALAGLIVLFVLPLLPLVPWSLAHGWPWPALLPAADGSAWAYAADPVSGVPRALATSALVAGATAVLATAAAIPAGLALGRRRFAFKGTVELLLLAPAAVPSTAVAFGLHTLFLRLGLAGGPAGVVLVHLVPALPYALLATTAAAALGDGRAERVARGLGAGPFRAFVAVTLPALMPGIAAGFAFAFLVSWSQYAPTLLIGGGRVVTLPLILTQFVASGRNDVAAVAAVLTVLPGALVLFLATPAVLRLAPRPRQDRR